MLRTYSVCTYLRRSLVSSASVAGPGIRRIEELRSSDQGENKAAGGQKVVNVYTRLHSWKSSGKLVDDLHSNVVYYDPENDDSGLVVINKPQGLAVKPAKDSAHCLESCLPALAARLGVPQLQVIKSVERWSSGVVLLGSSPNTQNRVQKSLHVGKCQRRLLSAYLGLVVGYPSLTHEVKVDTVEVKMEDCDVVEKPLFSDKHREPVINRNLSVSSSARRRRQSRLFHIAANTVAKSGTVPITLVRLQPSKSKNHFVPVWLSELGCPLLGDQMYDYRAKTLMGHKVKVGLQHTAANRQQKLPQSVMESLGVRKGHEWQIPKHLHQFRINLPDYMGRGKNLTVFAPPPTYFSRTSAALGIDVDFQNLVENDEVSTWEVSERRRKATEEMTDLEKNIQELDIVA